MATTFERFRSYTAERLGIDESLITLDSDLITDLHADSLDLFEIVTATELEFDLVIFDEELLEINARNVRELVALLERKLASA